MTTEGKATTLAFGYTDLRLDVVRPARPGGRAVPAVPPAARRPPLPARPATRPGARPAVKQLGNKPRFRIGLFAPRVTTMKRAGNEPMGQINGTDNTEAVGWDRAGRRCPASPRHTPSLQPLEAESGSLRKLAQSR